ncbi:MAG: hypothetical protein K5989_01370 [Lachnospiraceae bacterium]|nr:hypothetical protein [Lachnospiraceae bacterium]
METTHILVSNTGEGMEEALTETEEFGLKEKMSDRNARRLRLLAEETLGMAREITGEFSAMFWVEGDSLSCRIHLVAKTDMNKRKRRELLSVSSTGKNAAAVGIMGKIRDLIQTGMESYQDAVLENEEGGIDGYVPYYSMGMENAYTSQLMMTWSLEQYRKNLRETRAEEQKAANMEEAWDELEKSIVANLADDVRVGIRKDTVELTIYKSF